MGYTIGMPSLKLSNIDGKGGKHCGNFKKVASEALQERQGLDLDINPELSYKNIYIGFNTAKELKAYSDRHIEELNAWRAENGARPCDRRKLKSDTVVMCATIFKPPAEMMAQLTEEQRLKFLQDCLEIFKEFVGEENIKAVAFHFDERVPHLHILWEPMADAHRICAKDMHNLIFFGKLNREVPMKLRAKGWSMVDDCQAYDKVEEEQKRLEMGEEKYKEYRKAQKANRGRNSRQFKHEVEQQIAEKQQELERIQIVRDAAEMAAKQAKKQREEEIEVLDAELERKRSATKAYLDAIDIPPFLPKPYPPKPDLPEKYQEENEPVNAYPNYSRQYRNFDKELEKWKKARDREQEKIDREYEKTCIAIDRENDKARLEWENRYAAVQQLKATAAAQEITAKEQAATAERLRDANNELQRGKIERASISIEIERRIQQALQKMQTFVEYGKTSSRFNNLFCRFIGNGVSYDEMQQRQKVQDAVFIPRMASAGESTSNYQNHSQIKGDEHRDR